MLYWDHWGPYWDPTLAQAVILLGALESILGALVSILEYWSIMRSDLAGCWVHTGKCRDHTGIMLEELWLRLESYWERWGAYWEHWSVLACSGPRAFAVSPPHQQHWPQPL